MYYIAKYEKLIKFTNQFFKANKFNISTDASIQSKEKPITYSEEFKAGCQRGICTPMSIAALFTIMKRWKQPKCLLMDK